MRGSETPKELDDFYKQESFTIRSGIKTAPSKEKPTMILKGLILNLGGVNTDWIQIEVAGLLSSSDILSKKVAYLCASVLLDLTSEISVLVTQAIINDLQSTDLRNVILALVFLSNLTNSQISSSVAPIIEKLLTHSNERIVKHAAAAALTIIRVSPQYAENFQSAVPQILKRKTHSTIMVGLYLAKAIVSVLPSTHSFKKSLIPVTHYLIRVLKTQITAQSTKEFHYASYQDPFLLINILSFLGSMNFHSDSIFDSVTSAINSVRPNSCTGRAVLFAAADTITSLFPHFHRRKSSAISPLPPTPSSSNSATPSTSNNLNNSNNSGLDQKNPQFSEAINKTEKTNLSSSRMDKNESNDKNDNNDKNENNDKSEIKVGTIENQTSEKREITGIMAFAQNQVCKLLSIKNHPNTLYSGLSALTKILYNGSEIRERHSADSIVIARYKDSIAGLLSHQDPSIRKRALDVIVALVDETNVETLVPELLEHLTTADKDFKGEMIEKTFWAIQRFSPSDFWNFQITEMLIIDSGPYIDGNMIRTFIYLVINDEDVKNSALQGFINLLPSYENNQPLIQAASFCVGEYFQYSTSKIAEISTFIRQLLDISLLKTTTPQTIGYILTAVAKLITRFNVFNDSSFSDLSDYCKKIFGKHQTSQNLDIQQRSGELLNFISSPNCDTIFAPFPPTEDPTKKASPKSSRRRSSFEVENSGLLSNVSLNNNPTQLVKDLLTPQDNDIQLLDLGDLTSNNTTNNNSNNSNSNNNSINNINKNRNDLDELLEIDLSNKNEKINSGIKDINSSNGLIGLNIPSIPGAKEAVKTEDFVIFFEIKKNEGNPNQIAIRVNTFGLSKSPLTKFKIQYGVPPGWKVIAKPQSSENLDPNSQKPIQQLIMLENNGSAKLQMKLLCSYLFGNQPLKTVNTVHPIFD